MSKNIPLHLQSYHRIIEWLGLEGTSSIIKLQPPHHRQSCQTPHLILDQAAQGPLQPGLERLQGWGIHSLSGQPVPAPYYSHSKELPPDIQPKSSLLQLKTISPCPAVEWNHLLSPFQSEPFYIIL